MPLRAAESATAPTSPLWTPLNAGFQTQHVHSMTAIARSYTDRPALATAAVDNDAWWRPANWRVLPAMPWFGKQALGDGNWVYADPIVDNAVLLWRHRTTNWLVDLSTAPAQQLGGLAVHGGKHFRSEHAMKVVQRGRGQGEARTLEMLALARSSGPANDTFAGTCDGSSIATDQDGSTSMVSLMRTADYKANRVLAFPAAASGGWIVESTSADVPVGAQRIWSIETPTAQTLFLFVETDPSGQGRLVRAGKARRNGRTSRPTSTAGCRPACTARRMVRCS